MTVPREQAMRLRTALEGVGILHLGLGAFHKSHQAVYTHQALQSVGGDWGILAVALRNCASADALAAQDHRYTLILRGASGSTAQTIGSIKSTACLSREPDFVLAALCDARIKVVTITVTEKGYGLRLPDGALDIGTPVIARDLATPAEPRGVVGLLVEALRRRRAAGQAAFAIVSCDNIASNGAFLRKGVLGFASRHDPALASWIAANVAFPATMVDRITPAPTEKTFLDAAHHAGVRDKAAVEAEAFHQWVIEDSFPQGRPAWEVAGAVFTADVAPYEKMKLRMLNGAHSLIAYLGVLLGHRHVRDAMADPDILASVKRHLGAAAATLNPGLSVDLQDYAAQLIARFRTPDIAHETRQIAMDGSQKLPHRIYAPASDALRAKQSIQPFALATAVWLYHCRGRTDSGTQYDLIDPRAAELAKLATFARAEDAVDHAKSALDLFPADLATHPDWTEAVVRSLQACLDHGVRRALTLHPSNIRTREETAMP